MAVNVEQVDFTFVEGNDPTVTLTIKADGAAVDLTGATVEVFIKTDVNKADGDASTVKLSSTNASEVEITDAANGKCKVYFTAAHFPDQTPRRHRVDVIKSSRRQTYGFGKIYVENV